MCLLCTLLSSKCSNSNIRWHYVRACFLSSLGIFWKENGFLHIIFPQSIFISVWQTLLKQRHLSEERNDGMKGLKAAEETTPLSWALPHPLVVLPHLTSPWPSLFWSPLSAIPALKWIHGNYLRWNQMSFAPLNLTWKKTLTCRHHPGDKCRPSPCVFHCFSLESINAAQMLYGLMEEASNMWKRDCTHPSHWFPSSSEWVAVMGVVEQCGQECQRRYWET